MTDGVSLGSDSKSGSPLSNRQLAPIKTCQFSISMAMVISLAKEANKPKPVRMRLQTVSQEYKHIVRVASADVDGQESLLQGLTKVKGVGLRISKAIINQLELDPSQRLGFIADDVIASIENIIKDPVGAGLPDWYVNRPRDRMSGKMLHLIGSDLDFAHRNDIDRLRRIKSWRGTRHQLGLKVRGQHTRTTGRGGIAVGVSRKTL